ncbi:hypothetical protein J31TS4_11280 [Paenibacillus sp. J31TS4]|uniref:hypothetical protein n=1 Tax=Paenibacillus sp. J31TS4 TaxID=2807195 RepID=UPI001B1384C9|nr:hypothetical protein [Paenibacillus sp. J31TS4]GIP37848.1 hypothetical protein J31TS4_11280 [Paenibacillus sp. J31TS4]
MDSHGQHQAKEEAKGGAGNGHQGHGGTEQTKPSEAVQAAWTFAEGKQPQANQDTLIRIAIRLGEKPVEKFDITHEQKQHLIIVSKDLSQFRHVHPDDRGGGVFEWTERFLAGGEYKLFADFVPSGGSAVTLTKWVNVAGEAAKPVPIQPDASLTKSVGGKEIALAFDRLVPNQEVTLTFTIRDDRTKKPVTNLQPYLGAVGHVVILSEDAEQYLHVHPMEERATGPDARFQTSFPHSGIYKIWGQFKHEDKVITVPFVVKVP